MKKSLLFAVAVVALATVSCKKERTCECTSTYTVNGVSTGTTDVDKYTTEKQSKKYFRKSNSCYSMTIKQTNGGVQSVTERTCTLK